MADYTQGNAPGSKSKNPLGAAGPKESGKGAPTDQDPTTKPRNVDQNPSRPSSANNRGTAFNGSNVTGGDSEFSGGSGTLHSVRGSKGQPSVSWRDSKSDDKTWGKKKPQGFGTKPEGPLP